MNTIEFDISVTHAGKKFSVHCSKFKVSKVPQVHLYFTEGDKEVVMNFFEVNEPGKRFFWFPLRGERNNQAKSIAAALGRSIKARQPIG